MTASQAVLFAVLVLVLAASFVVQALVMIYGWGIEPKSWGVISSGYIFTLILFMVKDNK